MTTSTAGDAAVVRNLRLYPLLQACRNLYFWQAVWFLYLEGELGPREAIVLAAVYDLGTVVLEVPSGYLCDVIGRRWTFVIACLASCLGCALLGWGSGFAVFALAQALQGLSAAFASGTGSALLYESLAATGREHELTTHEVRALDALIAETEADIARGYSYESREVTRWAWVRCYDGPYVPGQPRRYTRCWEPYTDIVRKPVAIDPAAEARKLAALKSRRAALAGAATAAVEECRRLYPE